MRSARHVERSLERELRDLDVVELDDAALHVGGHRHVADVGGLLAQNAATPVHVLGLQRVGPRERLLEGARRIDRSAEGRVDEPHVVEDHWRWNERIRALELGETPGEVPFVHEAKGAVESLGGLAAARVCAVRPRLRGGHQRQGQHRCDQRKGGADHRKGLSCESPRLWTADERGGTDAVLVASGLAVDDALGRGREGPVGPVAGAAIDASGAGLAVAAAVDATGDEDAAGSDARSGCADRLTGLSRPDRATRRVAAIATTTAIATGTKGQRGRGRTRPSLGATETPDTGAIGGGTEAIVAARLSSTAWIVSLLTISGGNVEGLGRNGPSASTSAAAEASRSSRSTASAPRMTATSDSRQIRSKSVDGRRRARRDVHDERLESGPLERKLPCQALVKDDPESEDIRSRVDVSPGELLGRHVRGAAVHHPGPRRGRGSRRELRDTEVDDLDERPTVAPGDEQIVGLQIAVDDPGAVGRGHPLGGLRHELRRERCVERLLPIRAPRRASRPRAAP